MVLDVVLWEHSPLLQNVSAVSAVLLFVSSLLIVRIFLRSNWDILTSRVFLEQEKFRQFLDRFLLLLVVYAISIGVADSIELLGFSGIYLVADVFTLVARLSVLGAVYLLYVMLRDLARTASSEDNQGSRLRGSLREMFKRYR